MNSFAELAGHLCKILLPIPEEVFVGNLQSRVAICTLSSIDFLKEISSSELMDRVAIAGRLFSENKGIDALIRYVVKHPEIDVIIVCGKEVPGHRAGHALLCAHKYGTDDQNRIINSTSPDPVLSVSKQELEQFQKIVLVDKIGLTVLQDIKMLV
jgi:tetrahydromethanopterin S-methyltransferase subunit A